jgi:hypothetical protein
MVAAALPQNGTVLLNHEVLLRINNLGLTGVFITAGKCL